MKKFINFNDISDYKYFFKKAMFINKNKKLYNDLYNDKLVGIIKYSDNIIEELNIIKSLLLLNIHYIYIKLSNKDKFEVNNFFYCNDKKNDNYELSLLNNKIVITAKYCDVICLIGKTRKNIIYNNNEYYKKRNTFMKKITYNIKTPIINLDYKSISIIKSVSNLINIYNKNNIKLVMLWIPKIINTGDISLYDKYLIKCINNISFNNLNFSITFPKEFNNKYIPKKYIEYNKDNALKNADYIYITTWNNNIKYDIDYFNDWNINNYKFEITNNAKIIFNIDYLSNKDISNINSYKFLNNNNCISIYQTMFSEILNKLIIN